MKDSPLAVEVRHRVDIEFIDMMGFVSMQHGREHFARCSVCEKRYYNPMNDGVQHHMARHALTCGRRR